MAFQKVLSRSTAFNRVLARMFLGMTFLSWLHGKGVCGLALIATRFIFARLILVWINFRAQISQNFCLFAKICLYKVFEILLSAKINLKNIYFTFFLLSQKKSNSTEFPARIKKSKNTVKLFFIVTSFIMVMNRYWTLRW